MTSRTFPTAGMLACGLLFALVPVPALATASLPPSSSS